MGPRAPRQSPWPRLPSPVTLGSTVTLTATVTGAQNQPPTGLVMFFVNGAVVGEGTLSPLGAVTALAMFSTRRCRTRVTPSGRGLSWQCRLSRLHDGDDGGSELEPVTVGSRA